jgi:hypothetical protein
MFGLDRLNTADINNELLVWAGKPTIISIGYCYRPIPITDARYYDNSFSSSANKLGIIPLGIHPVPGPCYAPFGKPHISEKGWVNKLFSSPVT